MKSLVRVQYVHPVRGSGSAEVRISFGGEDGGLQSGLDEPRIIDAKMQQVEPPEMGRSGSKKGSQEHPEHLWDASEMLRIEVM